MHLIELLGWRSTPAAGVSIGLTRRCPLHCAHCSTNSTMDSEEHPPEIFERFVDTFRVDDHPEVLSMSGGEALLRPELVRSLALRARQVGTRSSVLSGLFFARRGRIPSPVLAAIDAVDHFSVSLDAYHEREVPRESVFGVLDRVIDRGIAVSVHLTGNGAGDAYVEGLVADIRRRFDDRVPMLVNAVSSFGRARMWLVRPGRTKRPVDANPCAMAAWPVVGFDGRIVACGNDDALDNPPQHLLLGHASEDSWSAVRARSIGSSMMRAIRIYGPRYIAARHGELAAAHCGGDCATCLSLSDDRQLADKVDREMARPAVEVVEQVARELEKAGGAAPFLQRYSVAKYADLAWLGAV